MQTTEAGNTVRVGGLRKLIYHRDAKLVFMYNQRCGIIS